MASSDPPADALLSLRRSIAANKPPITILAPDGPTSAPIPEPNLPRATHIQFTHSASRTTLPLTTTTRFLSGSGKHVDLFSIYFAWLKKDEAIPDYIAACRNLNEEITEAKQASAAEAGETTDDSKNKDERAVQNLVFAEKLDLITWLEGASEESEYIQPLDEEIARALKEQEQAEGAADVASGVSGDVSAVVDASQGAKASSRPEKVIDPRLREIYNMERRMGDRNSVLRGIKPTDFSHIRKHSEAFLGRARSKGSPNGNARSTNPTQSNPALISNRGKPSSSGRHRAPIIILSPSASSLLRMSNIKPFLNEGYFVPSDSAEATTSYSSANILQIARLLPSIDSQRPMRFVILDSTDQLKPDDWGRVVAVFTTGQLWQFKAYLWQSPPDLFSHALGIYVGWRGAEVPSTVRGWGRGVMTTQIDKYNSNQGVKGRWRDREVVEGIWAAIEESMREKGWGKDAGAVR